MPVNIANGESNKVVPKEGEADQTIRGAEGYRFKRVNEAEGDVAAFSAVLQQYVKAPEITRTRLYLIHKIRKPPSSTPSSRFWRLITKSSPKTPPWCSLPIATYLPC